MKMITYMEIYPIYVGTLLCITLSKKETLDKMSTYYVNSLFLEQHWIGLLYYMYLHLLDFMKEKK